MSTIERSITVTGEGKITVKPDTASLNLGVQVTASTATEALSRANASAASLIASLKAIGIADADIATSGLSIYPQHNSKNTISGYQASNNVTVTVREIGRTGELIDAATALDWGLVNRVVAPDALRAETLKLAETLKAKPRALLALGKALFYRQLEMGIEAAYQDASDTIACNFMEADAQEGVAAFLEKRTPEWK